jgi:hypothetical protein
MVNNANSLMPALWAQTNSNQPLSAAIHGLNTGTGDVAAAFRINNAANTFPSVFAVTNGEGSAGVFEQTNTAAWPPALVGRTNGMGAAVVGTSTSTSANANASEFTIQNPANPRFAVMANTVGTGSAGSFEINNASSNAAAVFASTNGPGSGISANNTSTGDAIFALKTGSAGSAGNFQSNNASNGAATIFGMTNSSTGTSLGLINSANGNAMTIFTGGMKVSSATVTTSTITDRAAAYFISSGGTTFSFSFPQAVAEGEIFFIYNSTGSPITVAGAAIPTASGKTCIYLGGALRAL